jgi:hypothetical protein
MRVCNVGLIVAAALLLDCAQTRTPNTTEVDPASDAAGAAAPRTPHVPMKCEEYQTEARELLKSAESCSRDDDCVVAGIDGECLLPFLCPTAVNRTAVDHLQSEARRLSEAHRSCSNTCAYASCVYGAGVPALCNPSTKRCEATSPARPMDVDSEVLDASKPDAPDAGASPDPRFSCAKDSDCAVKNVGNCCGYYPRCTNKAAEITPVQCPPGVGGVCGFPEITSCECRANTCVSLQDGREI